MKSRTPAGQGPAPASTLSRAGMAGEVKRSLAVIGIGNTLAGDDGAGVEVVRRLENLLSGRENVFLHVVEGDHFELADLLERAERIILVDAVQGGRPGELVFGGESCRAFAPSFHQADISSVMQFLEATGIADPFPAWEVWGISVASPTELAVGLSPEVEAAVERLAGILQELIGERVPAG